MLQSKLLQLLFSILVFYDVQSVMFEIKKQSKKGKYEQFNFKVSKNY